MSIERTETGGIYINNSRFMLALYVILFFGLGIFILTAYYNTGEKIALYISWAVFGVGLIFLFNAVKHKNAIVIDDESVHQRKLIGTTKSARFADIKETSIFRHKNTKYTVLHLNDGSTIKIMTLFLDGYKCEEFKALIDKKCAECSKN